MCEHYTRACSYKSEEFYRNTRRNFSSSWWEYYCQKM